MEHMVGEVKITNKCHNNRNSWKCAKTVITVAVVLQHFTIIVQFILVWVDKQTTNQHNSSNIAVFKLMFLQILLLDLIVSIQDFKMLLKNGHGLGSGHVNCRWQFYIKKKLNNKGRWGVLRFFQVVDTNDATDTTDQIILINF